MTIKRLCFVCAAEAARNQIGGHFFCKEHADIVLAEINSGAEGAYSVAMRLRGEQGKDVILRDVPEELHRAAKQEALNTGETMREVFIRALKQQLTK